MTVENTTWREKIIADIPSSLVLFLISLPLSMGVALASGVDPALGLASAIVGGILVGLFGGAPLEVAGPSAGLAVVIFQMVKQFGIEKFWVVVVLAGAIQLAAGVLKLGRYFRMVSPAVIRGMLSGIGLLIVTAQFHVMIDDKIHESGLRNMLMIPQGILKAISPGEAGHGKAAMIGVLTLAVIVLWDKFKPAKLKVVPGALLGAVTGAVVAAVVQLPIRYVVVPENIASVFTLPNTAHLGLFMNGGVWVAAATLAFVASAETLLCATALQSMHNHGGPTNYNRELGMQGVANLVCGVLGILPVAGVISRSTANVQAGARSKASAVMHSSWILVFVLFFPQILRLVPTSSLAAILIYVGMRLVNIEAIMELRKYGTPVMVIFVLTLAAIVGIDLLTGILLGLGLSTARLVYSLAHLEIDREERADGVHIMLHGAATFLAQPLIAAELEQIPMDQDVHINVEDLTFIDHACLELLSGFQAKHQEKGSNVTLEWEDLTKNYHRGGGKGADRVAQREADGPVVMPPMSEA